MADTAYDSDALRQAIAAKTALAVIPTILRAHSGTRSRQASLRTAPSRRVLLSKLKHFRRVATRFENTARSYRAVVTLAAIVLRLK